MFVCSTRMSEFKMDTVESMIAFRDEQHYNNGTGLGRILDQARDFKNVYNITGSNAALRKALACYDCVIECEPGSASHHISRAEVHCQLGDVVSATCDVVLAEGMNVDERDMTKKLYITHVIDHLLLLCAPPPFTPI